jgi:hypothetical protein
VGSPEYRTKMGMVGTGPEVNSGEVCAEFTPSSLSWLWVKNVTGT